MDYKQIKLYIYTNMSKTFSKKQLLSLIKECVKEVIQENQAINLDVSKLKDIEIDGKDAADAPDFSDAYIVSASYPIVDNPTKPEDYRSLTDEELDWLNHNHRELVNAHANEMNETSDVVAEIATPKVNLSEKGLAVVEKWVTEKGTRGAAVKCVDYGLNKLVGLTSSDLPDTATFDKGLDKIEIFLKAKNYNMAITVGCVTAKKMLKEEGGLDESLPPGFPKDIADKIKTLHSNSPEKANDEIKKLHQRYGGKVQDAVNAINAKRAKKFYVAPAKPNRKVPGEFVVAFYVDGKFDDDGSYYTDDKKDAVDTYNDMVKRVEKMNSDLENKSSEQSHAPEMRMRSDDPVLGHGDKF